MEKEFNDTLYRSLKYYLMTEYLSTMQKNLRSSNPKYNRLLKENNMLKKKYPNVCKVVETERVSSLNTKEADAITTIINNLYDLKTIELENMFLLGARETLYFIEKINKI